MIRWYILASLLSSLVGCATPVPPGGGPVDKTPPIIVGMYPPSNSVDFSGDMIRFEFSERVDRASFERSLTIVPEPTSPPDLRWKGRTLEMTFGESLLPATTYVITFDNSLRDEHNVALPEPIVSAIATGSVIDRGIIQGRLLDARTGLPVPNMDIVATRIDTTLDPLTSATKYRTQTGADGVFALRYLAAAPFTVTAFEDRNRNRTLDGDEKFAVPDQSTFVPTESDSAWSSSVWWVVNPDTIPPTVTSVRARSSRRIEVRYSEAVHFDTLSPSMWVIRDTTNGAEIVASGAYVGPSDGRRVFLIADSLAPSIYRIDGVDAMSDSSGNRATADAPVFEVAATADTMRLRLVGFEPRSDIDAGPVSITGRQRPGFRLNQYVSPETLEGEVYVTDTSGVIRPFSAASRDGVLWSLELRPPMRPAEHVRLEVASDFVGADSLTSAEFRRFGPDEIGSLAGYALSSHAIVVEVYSERQRQVVLETVQQAQGDFVVGDLRPGSYRLRVFEDRDADRSWDWGQITPYQRPEPMFWYADSVRVRAGWETVVDTLRFDRAPEN